MSIKDSLSDLIAANGYDINNDEVKSALLSLAGSNIINLPLDKKHMAIRILSLNELDKYIVNGTCDGSITANNINVWHWHDAGNIYNGACQTKKLGIHKMYFELSAYNTLNISKNRYIKSLNFYLRQGVATSTYVHSYNTPTTIDMAKNSYIYSYNFGAEKGITAVNDIPWLGYYEVQYIMSFRPILQFVDNNKSINIHY